MAGWGVVGLCGLNLEAHALLGPSMPPPGCVNTGTGNVGHFNTGSRSWGNRNSGSDDIGDCNSGSDDVGSRNTDSEMLGSDNARWAAPEGAGGRALLAGPAPTRRLLIC